MHLSVKQGYVGSIPTSTAKLPTNSSCVTIEIIHHIPLRVMQEDVYTCGLFYSFNELGENRQISSICYAHNLVVKGMGRT